MGAWGWQLVPWIMAGHAMEKAYEAAFDPLASREELADKLRRNCRPRAMTLSFSPDASIGFRRRVDMAAWHEVRPSAIPVFRRSTATSGHSSEACGAAVPTSLATDKVIFRIS